MHNGGLHTKTTQIQGGGFELALDFSIFRRESISKDIYPSMFGGMGSQRMWWWGGGYQVLPYIE